MHYSPLKNVMMISKWFSLELSLLLLVSIVAFAGFVSFDGSRIADYSERSDNDLTGEISWSWFRYSPRRYIPTPTPVCAPVITFAKNTQTRECRKFSNVCIPAGWSRVSSCPTPTPTPFTGTCTDSDGGKNYYIYGKTRGLNPSTGQVWDTDDSCLTSGVLRENYCDGNYNTYVKYNCLYGCKNGACVQSTPTPSPLPENLPDGCVALFENGPTNTKINIYFYEDGFNSNPKEYSSYVNKVTKVIFGGNFGGENFPGIEPFKSLKQEFNVFSYKNEKNIDDGSCWPQSNKCNYNNKILPELKNNCKNFAAPSDFGETDGNYNIIVVPFVKPGWGSSGVSSKRINPTTIKLFGNDIMYHGINYPIASLVHEFGHRIGVFDEEYKYYDQYLGAKTTAPNVDSFKCTKWCQGVNKQSECYVKYKNWLNCFKTKFIDVSSEIQNILIKNNLDYKNTEDNSWWGTCFDAKYVGLCGDKISWIVTKKIRGFDDAGTISSNNIDQQWVSNWNYCKQTYGDVAGVNACNLGLNCGGSGCYAATSFSKFIPSQEDKFMMGSDYSLTSVFNKHDENILRNNIINKIRYILVENMESK